VTPRWLVLTALAACHDGVDAHRATAWLEARGRAAPTWEPCLRMAVAMRDACAGDAPCANEVTRTFSYWCYAGHYRGPHAAGGDALSTSPCFWESINRHGDRYTQAGEPGFVTLDAWAGGVCASFHLPAPSCVAELHDVVASCDIGLTGAGP